ncbi:hypothetical protein HMPREF3164_08425 [Rothia sp. HMSC08A08]|uniref:hypothetical protein n=1 Tax=Rothia sp. HMSC08A08 TaxID=1581132 RepID=UPI0008A2D379|nr:hypothetical protein [Rothia sp. HMSC08A08]OFS78824.1 hypothetical protein HMPREF3164_08425 [Rothia sp. HMSC08A08]
MPKHANNDERETSSSQAGNVEDIEAYRRWYGEHHHGEFGFAQGKNGNQRSFGFDVANDGSYCLSRDGQAGTFEKAPKTGRAIPDMINELYGNKCTLNDPEAAQQAQSEYERIITEMHTHLLELIPAHPHLILDSAHPPHTSKGEETNFYTTLEGSSNIFEGDLPIGHTRIRAVPVAYRYEYGDGHDLKTHSAGSSVSSQYSGQSLHETSTSYAYPQVGNFHAYVTVTYAGQYSIDGGPWQFFGTEVSRVSEPVLVRVWESEVHSVGKTCTEDPGARGCPGHAEEPDVGNPNPQLRKVDVYTGQRWHLDDVGVGDSEGRLHPTWPNM